MKIVGIVGSNATYSHNRLLLQFIQKQFKDYFELEIVEIKGIPIFNQNLDYQDYPEIEKINESILAADGVIISTPEHNHTITSALKSVIEWLSYQLHPFEKKPVMVIGTSYYSQGTSRAQSHLREILNAPGVNAWALPGNEFLLGNAKEAFDELGQIKSEATVAFLETCLKDFVTYVSIVNNMTLTVITESSTDATSGASESWNNAKPQASQAMPYQSESQTPFDQALDKLFGSALSFSDKDYFDRQIDQFFEGKKVTKTPFDKTLDELFGPKLGIEVADIFDTIPL